MRCCDGPGVVTRPFAAACRDANWDRGRGGDDFLEAGCSVKVRIVVVTAHGVCNSLVGATSKAEMNRK